MTDHLEQNVDPCKVDRFVYDVELVRVIDGDTVVLDIDLGCDVWLKGEYCRLYGIDTPEVRGEERLVGLQATAYLVSMTDDAEKFVVRTYKDKKGKYGRWLVTLMADGVNINRKLVDDGYAREI